MWMMKMQLNELKIHSWLQNVLRGEAKMSDETIQGVVADIATALKKQFTESRKGDAFRWRMSNTGRPYCQLWYAKNKPEASSSFNTVFLLNMIVGDIVEAVFKGVMTEAGIQYTDAKSVKGKFGDIEISGTNDLTMSDGVWDVKTASNYSYQNKFSSAEKLASADTFGYVAQLCGYAHADNVEPGGWIVINKNSMEFKFVPYDLNDKEAVVASIVEKVDELKENKFRRCFEPVDEFFRRKPTGNKKLALECSFCSYRTDCWNGKISEEPSRVSTAAEKPMVAYITE